MNCFGLLVFVFVFCFCFIGNLLMSELAPFNPRGQMKFCNFIFYINEFNYWLQF